jgi:hypothetical protein
LAVGIAAVASPVPESDSPQVITSELPAKYFEAGENLTEWKLPQILVQTTLSGRQFSSIF